MKNEMFVIHVVFFSLEKIVKHFETMTTVCQCKSHVTRENP